MKLVQNESISIIVGKESPLFQTAGKLNFEGRRSGRRRFLLGILAAAGGYYGYRWLRDRPQPIAQRHTSYVTPNGRFYRVSILPGYSPEVDLDQWELEITGPSGALHLDYQELIRLPSHQEFRTLQCVGNPLGGTSIGNALWTVTPLAPLLQRVAGPALPELRASFVGSDGFHSSVPLAVALDAETVLAFEMNGEPLPAGHGFPVRVLIPNKYGMKQPRWLEKIEVSSSRALGYWERRGWSEQCDIKLSARVDSALPAGLGLWKVSGIAYCGRPQVDLVEISVDGGRSWQPARFTSEANPHSWVTWEFDWRPAAPGEYVLAARTRDRLGLRQVESYSGSFPSGASGLHRVVVSKVESLA